MASYTGSDKRLAYLFENGGGGGGSSTLAGLSDVDLDNLTDAQIIKWNATLQKWVNADESGGGGASGIGYFDGAHLIEEHINVTSLNYEAPKDCWAQCIAKAYNAGTGAQILFDGSIVFANANTYDVVVLVPCKKGTIITSRSGGNYGLYSLRLYEMLPAGGGGGGNANVWTGTAAEYEQQASQIPDDTVVLITDDEEATKAFEVYTTEERVIGEYDGKPLYRKILPTVQFSNSAYVYTHNLGIRYYVNIGGWCKPNGGSAIIPFPFNQNRWNGYCGIQATAPDSITFDSNWANNTVECYIEYTKEADYS